MVEESTDSPPELPEENDQESSIISQKSAENLACPVNKHSTNANHRRASTGSYHNSSGSKKNSIEKPDSTQSKGNVVPHYLRRSTGSCHDFCKFGKKHSSEENKARPWKRNVKLLPNELIPVQILVSAETRKEKVVNHKLSTDSRRHSLHLKPSHDTTSDSTKHKTSLEKAKVVEKKPSADAKNNSGDLNSCDTKPPQQATQTSVAVKSSAPRRSITRLTTCKPALTKKLVSLDPPEIIKSVCFPSEKVEVPSRKGSLTASKVQRSPNQQYASLKPDLVKVKSSSSSEKPNVRGTERRKSDTGTMKKLTEFKTSTKKALSPKPKLSPLKIVTIKSRKDGSLKLVSPLKNQKRVLRVKTSATSAEKVSEKTLHVIKTESHTNVFESIPDDHATSSFPSPPAYALPDAESSSVASDQEDGGIEHTEVETDKIISESHESPVVPSVPPPVERHSKNLRKSRVAVSEVKQGPPMKLKFKTGKVMDLKPDNCSPRRLRFRRARVLGAEDNKGSSGRTMKKAGANDNAARAENSTGNATEKVVLKHQDVQDKKDAQGLFNNVIEETASKLVESRKSKVKALVGAFETVISLQESKPSSSAVS